MLSEWWTYRLSDFLMFSPRLYGRLFESVNAAAWPVAALLIAAGAWALLQARLRAALAVAGIASASSAWLFLHQRYAPINWGAEPFVWAFGVQALWLLGLACLACLSGPWSAAAPSPWRLAGRGLAAWALLGLPLLGLLVALARDQSFSQVALFGLAPDPTVLYTLGVLMVAEGRRLWRALAAVVPLAWCLFSGAMHAAMALGPA